MRDCGECSECCILYRIEDLDKQSNIRCSHLKCNGHCSIYDDRPPVCKEFLCTWKKGKHLTEDERPDKLGVIFRWRPPDGRAKGFRRMIMANAPAPWNWQKSSWRPNEDLVNYKALEVAKRLAKMCPVVLVPTGTILGPWDEEGNLLPTAKWVKDPEEAHRVPPKRDLSATEQTIFNIDPLLKGITYD